MCKDRVVVCLCPLGSKQYAPLTSVIKLPIKTKAHLKHDLAAKCVMRELFQHRSKPFFDSYFVIQVSQREHVHHQSDARTASAALL